MLEKSFSIKDVIIYLIPGILNTFFFCLFISHLGGFDFLKLLKENISISVLGILVSFLIGFIFSQIQIIISNRLLKDKYRVLRTLKDSIKVEDFKPVICNEVRKIFKMDNTSEDIILKDEQIFFFCYNLVLEKADNRSVEYINRAKNLASFSTSLYLTIVLISINLFFYIDINTWVKISLLGLLNIFLFWVIRKITINFMGEFYKNTYRTFYLINNNS